MKGLFVALTDAVRDFLNAPGRFAVLATTSANGLPQQTVMWYSLLDDKTVMMNTMRGRLKDRNLARDPRASLCFENGYQYVTITGAVTLIDEPKRAQDDIHALAVKYHGNEEGDRMAAGDFSKQERVTILVSIDDLKANGF